MINNTRRMQRREFVELLSTAEREQPTTFEREQSLFPDNHRWDEVMLIWPDDRQIGDALPSVVVVEDGTEREFLAWAATYLGDFKPFTSYFRVMEMKQFHDLVSSRRSAPRFPVRAMLGLILGEAASYTLLNKDFRQLTPAACSATCSYALTRSLFVRELDAQPELVISRWQRARSLSNQGALPLNEGDIMNAWAVLTDLYAGEAVAPLSLRGQDSSVRTIRAICQYLRDEDDDLDALVVRELRRELPTLPEGSSWLGRTREERVSVYEELVAQLAVVGDGDSLIRSFALAYFVSRMSVGSLEHLRLLVPVASSCRSVFLWYGLLAGIHPKSKVASVGAGLGRRLIRDVQRVTSLTTRPTCDIALLELQMLSMADPHLSDLITSVPGQLEIEVAAGVNTVVRWPNRADNGLEASRASANNAETRELFQILSRALHEADATRRRLGEILQAGDQSSSEKESTVRKPYSKNKR